MSLLKRIEKSQSGGGGEKTAPTPAAAALKSKAPIRKAPAAAARGDHFKDLKERIQEKLLTELDPTMDTNKNQEEVRRTIQDLFDQILAQENQILSRTERTKLYNDIVADILGFGPIEILLSDDDISEVMVI